MLYSHYVSFCRSTFIWRADYRPNINRMVDGDFIIGQKLGVNLERTVLRVFTKITTFTDLGNNDYRFIIREPLHLIHVRLNIIGL